jgi:hypothetical protein
MDSAFFLNLYCLLYNQWYEICWVPEPGDAVAVDEIVAQIETDKVCDTMSFNAVYYPLFGCLLMICMSCRGI